MAEITFRIPSKAVQYGFIEVPFKVADGATPEFLASVYVNYVYAFQKEEQAALLAIAERPSAAPAPAKEATYRPGSREGAERQLAEGKNPRTVDEANEMAKQVIEKELGPVTEVESSEPWRNKVDAKPKPWETEVTAPAVLDATW